MELFLFILVNAAMFLRPAEIAPELASVPIYMVLILVCFLISLPKLFSQWAQEPITTRPVTICMFGMLSAVVLSHVFRGDIPMAKWWGTEFAKILMDYLLIVGLIDSKANLTRFLIAMLVLVTLMSTLALLQYHGSIDIPALKVLERIEFDPASGEDVVVLQLVGTGIFNDPNDLCMILTFGILTGIYLFNERKYGMFRYVFLAPTGLLCYALNRTQSRGGLLACLAGIGTLMALRIGARKTIIAAVLGLPVLLAVMGGRMSRVSTGEDTAQQRIELWRDAMVLFRSSPVFGIGTNTLADNIGLVAHNSYVHAFAEMGFYGGTFYIGTFVCSAMMLVRLGRNHAEAVPPDLRRVRPYLIAILVGFAVSFYSISRNYSAPAYLAVGLAEAYHRIATAEHPELRLRLDGRLIGILFGSGIGFLIFINIFLRVV